MSFDENRPAMIHDAIDALMKTMRMHHRCIEKSLDSMELHRGQRMMLFHLSHTSGAVSQKEIADTFEISPACVARTLKSLAQDGYIERSSCTEDTRRNNVRISPKGMKVVEDTEQIFETLDIKSFEGFSCDEIRMLTELASRLHANLSQMEKECALRKEGSN